MSAKSGEKKFKNPEICGKKLKNRKNEGKKFKNPKKCAKKLKQQNLEKHVKNPKN